MIGLATVFHIASGLVLVGLVFAMLRVRAERDLLRLMMVAARNRDRVSVGNPISWWKTCLRSAGLPWSGENSAAPVAVDGATGSQDVQKIYALQWLDFMRACPPSAYDWAGGSSAGELKLRLHYSGAEAARQAKGAVAEPLMKRSSGVVFEIVEQPSRL